jgi:hypothetical protein
MKGSILSSRTQWRAGRAPALEAYVFSGFREITSLTSLTSLKLVYTAKNPRYTNLLGVKNVTGAEPWALGEILLVPTRRGSIQPGCARPG